VKPVQGVTLPANAVQGSGSTGVVFLVRDTSLERRAVKLGASSGDHVVVLSGLAPGDQVAVGDFAKMRDGAAIRVEP
jgi:multidrug efflux pump subunit AcrA (membrane-fusion protein)